MHLYKLSFLNSEFLKIPEEERVFIILLANARNDIRHLGILIHGAAKGLDDAASNEKGIAQHHFDHLIRLFASTLHEAWCIINIHWNGMKIGKIRYPELSSEGKKAIKFLSKYFENQHTELTRIRNKLGFHYDTETAKPYIKDFCEQTELIILTGHNQTNHFFLFSELVRTPPIYNIRVKEVETAIPDKIRKVRDEMTKVMCNFNTFTDEYLVPIIHKMKPKTETVIVSEGLNPKTHPAVVIVADEYTEGMKIKS